MEKILLHACCAVCFNYPYELLTNMGFDVVTYFYNPNICPESEHNRRLDELKRVFNDFGGHEILYYEDYAHADFENAVKGFESCKERGERCLKCFKLRLKKTALKAKELNIKKITTTLTVSPHKVSKDIFCAGVEAANEFNLEFLKIDFKKNDGFKKTQIIANKKGLYKQSYCGCEFSYNT